jgi:putative tryptophan/tyrosine transport system substrate-binding protein
VTDLCRFATLRKVVAGRRMPFNQLKRREFIRLLGGAPIVRPLAAWAQQAEQVRSIGVHMPLDANDSVGEARVTAFLQGLQQSEWVDEHNVRIDYRWSTGDSERVRKDAMELVALAPEVILATGSATVGALRVCERRAAHHIDRLAGTVAP